MMEVKVEAGKAMKVLLAAYACRPNRGTEPGNGWNWAWHLAEYGHEVWVLTRASNRLSIETQLALTPIDGLHFEYIDLPTLSNLAPQALREHTDYLLWQHLAFKRAKKIVSNISIDIIHHVTFGSLNAGSQLWKLGRPFVFGPVGGGQVAPFQFRSYLPGFWRWEALRTARIAILPLNPFVRQAVRHAAIVFVTNQETARLAKRLGAKRLELFMPDGLPEHYFLDQVRVRDLSGPLRVLWIGRLLPHKGVRIALAAVARIRSPVRLTIAGDGPLGKTLPLWIDNFGLKNRVTWLGQVEWARLRNLYLDSDVLLFTSLRDSFGAQILEAMACALPIVALGHHGVRDLVPDSAAFKIPVTTPDETISKLAEALDVLRSNPNLRFQMAQAALAAAREHSWPKKVKRMSEWYLQILRK